MGVSAAPKTVIEAVTGLGQFECRLDDGSTLHLPAFLGKFIKRADVLRLLPPGTDDLLVERSRAGRLTAVKLDKEGAAKPESFIHIEIRREAQAQVLKAVEQALDAVLRDVRAAVMESPGAEIALEDLVRRALAHASS